MDHLGLNATCRASFGLYNTESEVDTLIDALELADETLDRVAGVFFNLAGSDSNPKRQALQRDFAPKLSAYSSEIVNNAALFGRIAALWDAREGLGLNDEQLRVLMLTHRSFVRAGAALALRLNSMMGWIMWVTSQLFQHAGVIREGMETISKPHQIVDRRSLRRVDRGE